MKKLLIYIKEYKKESILAPLFKFLEASFELFVPLVMAGIIDRGIAEGNRTYVVLMCLLMVLLGIVGLSCSATAQYFAAKAAVGFSKNLRRALFSGIQSMDHTGLDRAGTSTLITRMTSDINQVQQGVNMTLRLFLRSPAIVFGAMIMAFTIDVKGALIFAVAIPILSLIVFGIMLITMPMYKKSQAGLDKVLESARENLSGVRVIRAFHKEEEEEQTFIRENAEFTTMQKAVGRISGLMNPVTYIVINLALVVLIQTGAFRVQTGSITQGQLVALINYMSQILVELIKLANLIVTMTKAVACGKRVAEVLEMPAEERNSGCRVQEDPSAPEVEFSHVDLRYENAGSESLTDISFRAGRGQITGIIGGTGSGKSSLVNMIPGFYHAAAGRVLVKGVDIKEYPVRELRKKIAVVPQKAVLFKGTVRSNLCWGKEDATEEQMWNALKAAQAYEFVSKNEKGLDMKIDQGGKNLSGGQKQRLTIARALVREPEILILDDSSSALDYATDAKLRKAIRNLEGKITVFLVSQRASSVMQADQILVMDDGHLAGCGTHEELQNSCRVYREICRSQFRE